MPFGRFSETHTLLIFKVCTIWRIFQICDGDGGGDGDDVYGDDDDDGGDDDEHSFWIIGDDDDEHRFWIIGDEKKIWVPKNISPQKKRGYYLNRPTVHANRTFWL